MCVIYKQLSIHVMDRDTVEGEVGSMKDGNEMVARASVVDEYEGR